MLLNGGMLDGARLLSPKTMELMTMSHTSDLPAFGPGRRRRAVRSRLPRGHRSRPRRRRWVRPGLYGWSGIYGTVFWVDPKERLVAIMMVQRYPGSTVAAAFQPLVYQALIK